MMAVHASTGKLRQRKSLGQCFLQDRVALETIAAALDPLRKKTVVEIGGGDGALTQYLTEAQRLIVYELDPRFAERLQQKAATFVAALPAELIAFPRTEIRNEDFLGADLAQFKNNYLLTGNIPYAISGLILRKILTEANRPERLVFTVQKEYAERLLGLPHENFFSNWLRVWGEVKKICTIKRTAFSPAPAVDSMAIRINFLSKPLVDEPETFARFLKLLFRQPRKTIGNNLKQSGVVVPEALQKKRPHELTFDQILALYRATKK